MFVCVHACVCDVCVCVYCVYARLFTMENGDTAESGLSESYLAQSYAVMEGKHGLIISCTVKQVHIQRLLCVHLKRK